MQNLPSLLYWIKEREQVRIYKQAGLSKPWSKDPVFQRTYFCNVQRENDKVTKFIRQMYSPHVSHPLFVHNIILSRFLNWPPTLEYIQYIENQVDWDCLGPMLHDLKDTGVKVWGNAYVVTTHGIPMDKIDYLCDRVMPSIEKFAPLAFPSCRHTADLLMFIEGISTFMAGQVVADLKNTEGHPLQDSKDWWTFALPGPGSRRGMDWLYGEKVPESQWYPNLMALQRELKLAAIVLCAQDIQNCLCEFDKYMRVKNGTGRSKRIYNGT